MCIRDSYSDADWGDCPDTARSTTGFVLMLAGAAIDWRSKLQPTVALSTVEAEAMALCAATVEVAPLFAAMASIMSGMRR